MDPTVQSQGYGFAKYPSVRLYSYKLDKKTGTRKFTVTNQLIFGDWIGLVMEKKQPVTVTEKNKTYVKVHSRSQGYVLPGDILPDRILEVNFIDVGQGDGCHVVTPDDKHFIIDAGPGDNMWRFLKWRFNLKKGKTKPPRFTAVISHSDSDHYRGFGNVFAPGSGINQKLAFEKIYHNGLVETSGSSLDSLGTVTADKQFVTGLCDTDAQFKALVKNQKKPGVYISTLLKSDAPKEALRYGKPAIFKQGDLVIEPVGPFAVGTGGGAKLPVFGGDKGKTKNGNSVILRLTMGKLKILLGGDLNSLSEDWLLSKFSGIDMPALRTELSQKKLSASRKKEIGKLMEEAVLKSRAELQVDIAKSCHHGSSDFTTEFLRALNPIVTVISSGDEESYCHPRPETLGTIGKYARGDRPMIFSTELARSTREFTDLKELSAVKKKERTVTVYGMINVRSDGNKIVIAQKLEKKAQGRAWDIHCLEWKEATGSFEPVKG